MILKRLLVAGFGGFAISAAAQYVGAPTAAGIALAFLWGFTVPNALFPYEANVEVIENE